MSKLSDRLKDYQNQMSIYAEQHKIILASDVLDMIEQLQEDLKDDIEEVVAELEEAKEKIAREDYCRTKHYIENDCEYKDCFKCCAEYLIDIVRKGGVE